MKAADSAPDDRLSQGSSKIMRQRTPFVIVGTLLLIGLLLGGLIWREQRAQQAIIATLSGSAGGGQPLTVARAVRGDDDQSFARATAVRPFTFPADYGPHREYRTEWWYYTGNLESADGRHFGYQLTFFRQGLRPDAPARPSSWATQEVYLAHLGLTDVAKQRFYAADQLQRGGAIGLAGAQAEPFRVFIKDWSVSGSGDSARLKADGDGVALDLEVRALKPATLQGDRGLSQKGPEPGNASYYFSLTRMETQGTLTVDGQSIAVRGLSWMDREWGTSALSQDMVGWDWFALQLADGRDIMWGQLRRADGTFDTSTRQGTLTSADGTVERLSNADVQIDVLSSWLSPNTGARYPAEWRVQIARLGLDLNVKPYIPDQELRVGFQYWEGAVAISGSAQGQPISGSGYVELTGYAEQAQTTASQR